MITNLVLNNGYTIDNPYLLSVEEVVKRLTSKSDASERELYKTYEEELRCKESCKESWGSYPFSGGINWRMSPQEINEYVQCKFQELRQAGVLLFRSEFEERFKGIKFRALGKDRFARTDLKRLWGTEYLNGAFKVMMCHKPHLYRVPRTIIIVKDEVTKLKVWINETPFYLPCLPQLCIDGLEMEQAEIQSEFIEGTGCAKEGLSSRHKKLIKVGYSDDGDDTNILRTEDGTMYVVDTEAKSFGYFHSPQIDERFSLYAEERFKHFARNFTHQPILVPISK